MINSWKQNFPSNKAVQWCIAVFNGNTGNAAELIREKNNKDDKAPWEATFRDTNFDLVVRLFE